MARHSWCVVSYFSHCSSKSYYSIQEGGYFCLDASASERIRFDYCTPRCRVRIASRFSAMLGGVDLQANLSMSRKLSLPLCLAYRSFLVRLSAELRSAVILHGRSSGQSVRIRNKITEMSGTTSCSWAVTSLVPSERWWSRKMFYQGWQWAPYSRLQTFGRSTLSISATKWPQTVFQCSVKWK